MLLLGLMSGTSLDGMDLALCECRERTHIRLRELWSEDFPRPLARRLHAAARGEATSWETAQLHHDLGRFYAAAAQRGLTQRKLRTDAVGLHGQTIFHRPPAPANCTGRSRKASASAPPAATFQLGEPAYLAEALRVPVVSNFRAADLAAGGQGAPLATLFHQVVFARRGEFVAVNNLGGISNVTALDWSDREAAGPQVLAFDTGPANVLLDLAMRELTAGRKACDLDGRWAARGWVKPELAARWLHHRFFTQAPPKSTGREEFGEPFFRQVMADCQRAKLSPHDILATLTWFTARSLALNYDRFVRRTDGALPGRVILCGGGAANPILREHLDTALSELAPALRVQSCEEHGWPRQAVEPAAFALLAHYRLRNWPGNLPATTGAAHPCLLGSITTAANPAPSGAQSRQRTPH